MREVEAAAVERICQNINRCGQVPILVMLSEVLTPQQLGALSLKFYKRVVKLRTVLDLKLLIINHYPIVAHKVWGAL